MSNTINRRVTIDSPMGATKNLKRRASSLAELTLAWKAEPELVLGW